MQGHIQQRGKDSWRVKVFVGRDAAGGRRYVERTVLGCPQSALRQRGREAGRVSQVR